MRIHTDTLTESDLYRALHAAWGDDDARNHTGHGHFWLVKAEKHGSRKRDHAFEVALAGDGTVSKRRRNPGTSANRSAQEDYAATWDQWGWFLAELFKRDPNMTTQYYATEAEFHAKTQGKFIINEEA